VSTENADSGHHDRTPLKLLVTEGGDPGGLGPDSGHHDRTPLKQVVERPLTREGGADSGHHDRTPLKREPVPDELCARGEAIITTGPIEACGSPRSRPPGRATPQCAPPTAGARVTGRPSADGWAAGTVTAPTMGEQEGG